MRDKMCKNCEYGARNDIMINEYKVYCSLLGFVCHEDSSCGHCKVVEEPPVPPRPIKAEIVMEGFGLKIK